LLWNAYVNVLGKHVCTVDNGWSCGFGVKVRGVSALRSLLFGTGRGWNNYYKNSEYEVLLYRPSNLYKKCVGVGWHRVAQDRKWWYPAVKSVMNFWVV